MDTTELPVPPTDPNASWEDLPELFQQCATYLASLFALDPPPPPETLGDSPEQFVTNWLNLRANNFDDDYAAPGSIRQVTIMPAGGNWKIFVPMHIDRSKKKHIVDLLADPDSRVMSYKGSEAFDVAEWLNHFLYYLGQGLYRINVPS